MLACILPGHYAQGNFASLRVVAAPSTGAPAPPREGATTLQLGTADVLKFDRATLQPPAGAVAIAFKNTAALLHSIGIKGNGVDVKGPVARTGGVSTVTANLAPGIYTFYCSVPGNEGAGMSGTLTVTAGGAPPPPPPPPPPSTGTTTLQLTAVGELRFDKGTLQAPAGTVTIQMKNTTPLEHSIAIKGSGVDARGKVVQPGGTSTVTANLAAGTYTFYCTVGGHEGAGMRGTLTVT